MTHFRTFPTSDLYRLPPATKRRIKSNLEGLILTDDRGTVGAIVSVEIVKERLPRLMRHEGSRATIPLKDLRADSWPLDREKWLKSGVDLVWLTTNNRKTHVLIHPRHKAQLSIPTFRVGVTA